MRLIDCPDDPDCVRLTFEKLLHASDDRSRSGTMSATGVGRDDQDFRDTLLLRHLVCLLCLFVAICCVRCAFLWLNLSLQPATLRAPLSPRLCAPSSSLVRVS